MSEMTLGLNKAVVGRLVSGRPFLDGEQSVTTGEDSHLQPACVQPGAASKAGLQPQHLCGLQVEETTSVPSLPLQLDQRHTAGSAAVWSSSEPGRKEGDTLGLVLEP